MSITIFIGGLINILIPNDLGRESSQFFWGFLKDFFNKLIMSILTMQVIVLYFGIMKTEFYYSREKLIFIIGTIICAGVSVGIAIIFNGLKVVDDVYHEYLDDYEDVKDPDLGEELKKRLYSIVSIEMIFSGVIFVINVFCLIVVMNFISKKHKEAKEGLIEDLGYKNQLIRFIFMFFLNIIAIVSSSVFLVFDVFDKKANESIYLATCFIIDLCYSINKTVYVETLKIFCKSKAEKLNGETELKKQNTFDQNDEGTVDDD
jgi:hypothetical protein